MKASWKTTVLGVAGLVAAAALAVKAIFSGDADASTVNGLWEARPLLAQGRGRVGVVVVFSMVGFLAALGEFLGRLLREILPGLLRQGRRHRRTRALGTDEELQHDIDQSIEDQVRRSAADDSGSGV